MQEFLEIGKIVRTHGVKGAVKIISYLDSVNFSILKNVYIGLKKQKGVVKSVSSLNGDAFSVTLDIIPDMNTAEKYKNQSVFIIREEYNQFSDKIYLSDLIGALVLDENDEKLGELVDYNEYGASTILEIRAGFSTYSIPYVEEYISYDETKQAFVTTRQKFKDIGVWE